MTKTIQGKVARVLNSRELALNIGSVDGVKEGMLFDVLDAKGEDIRDPDTDEILGSIQRPKVRVKIVRVQDKLCVASTYKATEINVGGSGDFAGLGRISTMLMPPKYVKRFETLKTTEETWEDLEESESFVKTGDPAMSVRDFTGSVSLE